MNSKIDYEQALEEIENLHSAATILAEASRLIRNPDVNVNDIIDVLKLDMAITAEIIHISNSAYYSLAKPSKDLKTSVSQIGLVELMKLTGLCVSRNLYSKSLSHYNLSAQDYWIEGLSIALVMESIAKLLSCSNQEWYTIGLLCTIGKSAINDMLEKEGLDDVYDSRLPLPAWEIDHVGFDHTYASASLLRRWEFPEEIVTAILYHPEPEKNPISPALSHGLRLACRLVRVTGVGFSNELGGLRFLPGDIRIPGYTVTEDDIYNILEESRTRLNNLKSELGIK